MKDDDTAVLQEILDSHRTEWSEREARLPEWLQKRLQRFRDAGGENFERLGWGYELVCCELAMILLSEQFDYQGYLEKYGHPTENQILVARSLVAYRDYIEIVPAALVAAVGSSDYS